jgi:hypothetical protein
LPRLSGGLGVYCYSDPLGSSVPLAGILDFIKKGAFSC